MAHCVKNIKDIEESEPLSLRDLQRSRYTLFVCGTVGHCGENDAGVNILFTEDMEICPNTNEIIKLSARVRLYDKKYSEFIAYELRPRSSIGKTTLILQNSPGTMDLEYQGVVRAALFNLSNFDS